MKKLTPHEFGRTKGALTDRRKRARPPAPKMGRPRKAEDVRIARGVRLNPELLARVDKVIHGKKADNVANFTEAVERALTHWLNDVDAGLGLAVRDPRS